MTDLTAKDPEEAFAIEFDFTSVLDTITSATCTVEGYSSLLNGPAQAAGSVVRQRVHNGYDGADYQVRCVASDGIETYVLTATLPVRFST